MIGLKHHDAFGTVGPVSAAVTGGARQHELEALVAALPIDSAPQLAKRPGWTSTP
jgi:hypothetical protein